MDDAQRPPTVRFQPWAAGAPRTCAQAMDARRTSCPGLPAWGDALDGGLVEVGAAPPGAAVADSPVAPTPRRRALLAAVAAVRARP